MKAVVVFKLSRFEVNLGVTFPGFIYEYYEIKACRDSAPSDSPSQMKLRQISLHLQFLKHGNLYEGLKLETKAVPFSLESVG
jgi:hypothetical protein